jgi:hypothetical protein
MLEGRSDYDLTVAKVSLTEKEEMEQNIFMNNVNSQGDFDLDILKNLINDIDIGNAGLEMQDLNVLGVELDLEKFKNDDVQDIISTFDNIKQLNREAIKAQNESGKGEYKHNLDVKAVKKDIDNRIADEKGGGIDDIHEDYVVFTFSSWQAKERFLKRFEFVERERYIKGEVFEQIINKHLGE